jgi:hypothetical protein
MRALRSDRTERVPGLDPRPRAPHLEETLVEYIRHYGCKSSGSCVSPALRDELAIGPLGVNGDMLLASPLIG